MYAEERRLHILGLLKKKNRVDVAALASQLDISPETIRRDLNEMEADGYLKRTHGGAIYLGKHDSRPSMPMQARKSANYEKKAAIARAAAAVVRSGEVIAVDNSTTAGCLLEFIPERHHLTIITYSLQVVLDVVARPDCNWRCVSLGGAVDARNLSVHGPLARDALAFFQPQRLFLSCAGIDAEGRMTEGDFLETEIKRELIRCSQKTYLLVDETKWGQNGAFIEGAVADMHCVVTNSTVDESRLAPLRERGVEIVFDLD